MKMDKPQIISHLEKSLNFSVFDGRWIPCSAKFVILGGHPNGSGALQIYEIDGTDVNIIQEVSKGKAFKCGTFGASSLKDRHLATGDFEGKLQIWNLEDFTFPVYSVKAHQEIINCIDGIGGQGVSRGAPEIVTGSRDGLVKVWDPRLKEVPVVTMEPYYGETTRDCWSVSFGKSFGFAKRAVCAGYDNGDIKLFDLRQLRVIWEANLNSGVCSVEFDRKDIPKNNLIATTLESKFYVFNLDTLHPKEGYAHLIEKAHNSTIWACKPLPQNRKVFMTCGGSGSLCLWKYIYPKIDMSKIFGSRNRKDGDGFKKGTIGSVELLQNSTLSTQPIASFDWSCDKLGLALCTGFNQAFRVLIITELDQYILH